MPRQTKKSIAEAAGVTYHALLAAESNGLNVWNPKAVKKWVETKRPRAASKSPKPSGGDHQAEPELDLGDETPDIEALEIRLRRAKDLTTAKVIQTQIAGLRTAQQVRADARELVPSGEVRADVTRVVSAARAELLKLSADLPPKLEGLPAGKMQRIIRDDLTEILERLSDESGKLYK